MPKYRKVKIIDEAKPSGYKQTSVVTVVGGSGGNGGTPSVNAVPERPRGEKEFLARNVVLVRSLDASSTELYVSHYIFTVVGAFLGISEVGKDVEVVVLDSYAGEHDDGHKYIVSRAAHGTSPGTFTANKAVIFDAQRNIELDTSTVQPSLVFNRDFNEGMMWTGFLNRVDDTFKSLFHDWLDWRLYGVAADTMRISQKSYLHDVEIKGSGFVSGDFTVVPGLSNAGAVLGATPTGNGLVAVDEQNFPWLQAVSVMDGDTEDLLFNVDDAISFSSEQGILDFGSDKVVLGGNQNGIIVPTPLTDEHYLTVSPSIQLADGRHFAEIKVGGVVATRFEQTTTSNTDQEFTSGVPFDVISMNAIADFPVGSEIQYSLFLSEEGGEESPFQVKLFIDGTEEDSRAVQIKASSASVDGTFKTTAIIPTGQEVKVQVVFTEPVPAASGWTRASRVTNLLRIKS